MKRARQLPPCSETGMLISVSLSYGFLARVETNAVAFIYVEKYFFCNNRIILFYYRVSIVKPITSVILYISKLQTIKIIILVICHM